MSTALDEAATALTRMKTEKQTYEAFLRGANQAPPPLAPPSNPQPSFPPISSVASSSNGGNVKATTVVGGGRVMSQQKTVQSQIQQPSPVDSMQTVQRLLTQGILEFTIL